MTEETFRSVSQNRDGLKAWLESDIGRVVTGLARDKQTPGRMADAGPMIPSERQFLYAQNQTFQAGWHECIRYIYGLTNPLPEPKSAPKESTLKRAATQPPIQTKI